MYLHLILYNIFYFPQYQWSASPTEKGATAVPIATDQQRSVHEAEQGHAADVEDCRAIHHMGVCNDKH